MGMNTRGKSKKKIKENDNPFLNLNANAKENDELAKASIKTIANSVIITESDNKRIDRSKKEESSEIIDPSRKEWLYYTRSPLMDNYRDNLYREYYSLSVLLSLRGDNNNERTLGLSLKLIDLENKKEYRVGELESFLFSCVIGEKQNIEDDERVIELEDFSKAEAKLIRFLNNLYAEAKHIQENGKLWFKDYNAYQCLSLLKDVPNIRLESRVITFSDEVLNLQLESYYNENKDLVLNLSIKDVDLNRVYTFGENCDFVLYKDIFYETNPSYPRIKKNIFKDSIVVKKDYIKDFCSRVLPNLKKDFDNIELPEDIKENDILAFPAQALVFLDYDGTNVFSTIKFKYGSFTVDPYSGKFTSSNMFDNEVTEIYRDTEKEEYFCRTLSKYLEKVGDYTFATSDDEKIFYLCYKILPALQDRGWTCYYSESFKSLKLNVKPLKMRVSLTKDINFFEINFSFEGVKELHDLSEIVRAVKVENKEYIRLQNGSFVPIDLEVIDYIAKMFKENPIEQKEDNRYLLPMFSAPYFADMLEKHSGIELDLDDNAVDTIANIKRVEYDETPPKDIVGEFRSYQLIGYKWLRKLADMSLNGILADDMGLGKSFQTIATILKEKENGNKLTSLVVAPTSCVANWECEIKKFAPSLEVIVLSGNLKTRMKKIKAVSNYDVAVISYSTLRRDVKALSENEFNYLILDEAQHIKNANTQNAKMVKSLKSLKRLALSGTPIENSISEMWSMFDFLMPGFLGKHKDFVEDYEAPILAGLDSSSEALDNLKTRIAPFILRRLKTDVLTDLPPKHTVVSYCDLTKDQKELYMSILEAARIEIFETVKRKGFAQSHIEIFSALTRLRQVCCHPRLMHEDLRGESHTSGKFNMFIEMIKEAISGGHSVLVFSSFTRMLNLMRSAFKKLGIDYFYLDGATKDRMDLVHRFNAGEAPIFLLSLKAAGTGLTLTQADTVMHYDLWWNPAVEDQATDRAYRIGQKRVVTNYKLITRGTIEEKILELQNKKRLLIDTVVGDSMGDINKLSWDEVKNLIN
ncbi:HepA, Superfamily II D/R helicase, SNF2 family [Brachyspira intermedia PWS/A]|uniref:HepA, Superfamily II D/R helicase, SNF2 family n=2 Tax=Brachyspira intermedia TaxID=84377 RepID=G0EMK2_BRAIP|nr:HepA, Superfamily II D/R helicase, SNF2 family [Brachyspira intermedia PWS/A]